MTESIRRQDFVQKLLETGQTPESLAEKIFDTCATFNGDGSSSVELPRERLLECVDIEPYFTNLLVARYGLSNEEVEYILYESKLFVDKPTITKQDLLADEESNADETSKQFDICDAHIGNGDGYLSFEEMKSCTRRGPEIQQVAAFKDALRRARQQKNLPSEKEIAAAPLPQWVSYPIYALIALLVLALVFRLLAH